MMENSIIEYVLQLAGWPNGEGIFAPGGSISNMYGLICARFKIEPDFKSKGMYCAEKPLVAFTSEEVSYLKADFGQS